MPEHPLCLKFCFLGNAVGELDGWQADLWGKRAGEVKIPRKRTLLSLLPLDLWMMDLMAAIPRLLYSLRNKLLFQGRSRCSELKPGARRSKCLTLVQYWVMWGSLSQLGSLWCSCSGGAIISYWEPNTIACLSVCSWGLCLFFPSSAQTQLHCSVAWGIYSWPDGCSLLPPWLQGVVLIPRELKQHLRRWKFQNPFSRLKKAGVPFGAVLPWGISAFSLCSVKENGKSGKPFENGRFLPFPSANGVTQPELRLLPSLGLSCCLLFQYKGEDAVVLRHFPDPRDTAEEKATLRVAKIRLVLLHHPSALQGSVGSMWDWHRGHSSGLGQRIPKLRASYSCPSLSRCYPFRPGWWNLWGNWYWLPPEDLIQWAAFNWL